MSCINFRIEATATSNSNLVQSFELSSFKSHGQPCILSLRLPSCCSLDIKFLWTQSILLLVPKAISHYLVAHWLVTPIKRVDRRPAFYGSLAILVFVSLSCLSVGYVAHSNFDRPGLTSYKSLCLGNKSCYTQILLRARIYTLILERGTHITSHHSAVGSHERRCSRVHSYLIEFGNESHERARIRLILRISISDTSC